MDFMMKYLISVSQPLLQIQWFPQCFRIPILFFWADNGRQIAQFFGQCSKRVRYLETSAIHGIVSKHTCICQYRNYSMHFLLIIIFLIVLKIQATDTCGYPCSKKMYFNKGCLNCGRSAVHEALSYLMNTKLYRPGKLH